MKIGALGAAVASTLLLLVAPPICAQESSALDIGRLAIAGYGDVTYIDQEESNSSFISRFIPIFLFQLSEKLHIEAELEFGIAEEGGTEVEMEYADMHYFLNNNTTITAGKFLLPFGQFGSNLHPSWINKLASPPAIYGHGGNGSMTPLVPVLSDTGINVRNSFSLGRAGKLFTDFYAVNGPRLEAPHGEAKNEEEGDGHFAGSNLGDHDDHDEAELEFPELAFEARNLDNNDTMAFGGRVAYAFLPQWELGLSYYSAAYSDDGDLDYTATNIDFNWIGSYSSIRGEIIGTATDAEYKDGTIKTFDRNGWYVQGTWQVRQLGISRLNTVELAVRRSEITEYKDGERTTFGINYWLEPSAVIKIGVENTNLGEGTSDDRLFVQLAFGF